VDEFFRAAVEEAERGLAEGGIPIGSVLVHRGRILGRGHNRRVQRGSVVLHGEMDALENAGRRSAQVYRECTIYTTLSPCAMCSGAILLYGIPRVVVGENRPRLYASMLAAQALGVAPEDLHVTAGDTGASPLGHGAYASRQAVVAGNAVHLAARAVAEKARQAAATMLEVAPDDLELSGGVVRVKGADLKRTLGQIANALSGVAGFPLPASIKPGLDAAVDFAPPAITYTNGSHVVEVEVDPETGAVKLTRYVVVHDCGRMINPMLVEGQVHGGVAHGVGMTLYEWMRYDAAGQPLTVTFADYLLPTSVCLPPIEIHHLESPTPLNPLGVKGAAESGTIGAPPAIVSAIEDALRPLAIRITELPVTPERLLALIRAAQGNEQGL